jgi:hypothetical protein
VVNGIFYLFITHDFIFEAIAYHYGRQNQNGRQSKNQQQQQILKYLSSSYIANKVTVYKPASNEDLCIHISEDMYLIPQLLNTSCMSSWGKYSIDNLLSLIRHKTRTAY